MINFLKCDAKAILKLVLELSYQSCNGKIAHEQIEIDTDTVYKITIADNMNGLETLNGRITAFTMCPEREVMSFVNQKTKPSVVDTITMDCSDNKSSTIRVINICDIRKVEKLSDTGFEEITRENITTFK